MRGAAWIVVLSLLVVTLRVVLPDWLLDYSLAMWAITATCSLVALLRDRHNDEGEPQLATGGPVPAGRAVRISERDVPPLIVPTRVVHNAPVFDRDPLPCCWGDPDNLPVGHRVTHSVTSATCRGPIDSPDKEEGPR